jgi:SAM-dependent methyltransferase
VRAAPPIETHGRYDVPGRSAGYATRNPTRHRAELALLARVWPAAVENAGPAPTVLDVPCGAGRLSTFVGGRGGRWIGADRAAAMLTQARAAGAGPLVHADARAMPFRDAAVDGVVVFRFLHHLERDAAHAVVAEAARVARAFVVVSFFHPVSAHGVVRTIRTWLSGRSRTRHALTCGRLDGWLAVHGFERCAAAAQSPFLRDLWIVAYRRR